MLGTIRVRPRIVDSPMTKGIKNKLSNLCLIVYLLALVPERTLCWRMKLPILSRVVTAVCCLDWCLGHYELRGLEPQEQNGEGEQGINKSDIQEINNWGMRWRQTCHMLNWDVYGIAYRKLTERSRGSKMSPGWDTDFQRHYRRKLKVVDEITQIKCTQKPMPLNSGCILSLVPKTNTEEKGIFRLRD